MINLIVNMLPIILLSFVLTFSYGATIPEKLEWDNRIVGGNPTDILIHPYQVSLEYFHRHRCGGAIISDLWVLSAAHCTQVDAGVSPILAFAIRVGSSFIQSEGLVIPVNRIVDHELYGNGLDYDITLIQLGRSLTFTSEIQPVALPTPNQREIPGARCVITGWGALWQGGPGPLRLQEVSTPWISNESCQQYYFPTNVTPRMMCSGSPYGGRDACQGDSGGPLVVDRVLIGIVSWGRGCAQPNFPGVYAYVVPFRNWITEIAGI